MIIIMGTGLDKAKLPFSDVINYSVETNVQHFQIKLQSSAKAGRFDSIFIASHIEGVTVPEELKPITSYFETDEELLLLLSNDPKPKVNTTAEASAIEEVQTESKVVSGINEVPQAPEPEKSVTDDVRNTAEDVVDPSLLDMVKFTPAIEVGMSKLDLRDRMINQKNAVIEEMRLNEDRIYQQHEKVMLELAEKYTDQVDLANSQIEKLQEIVKSLTLTKEQKLYMQNFALAENTLALHRAGITVPQSEAINAKNKAGTKPYIYAAGPGVGLYSMLREVKSYVEEQAKTPVHVYDFTGDPFLAGRLGLKRDLTALDVAKGKSPKEVGQKRKSTLGHEITWYPTIMFHDLALLAVDWANFLERAMEAANGAEVIILFNSVTSSSVRQVASRLSVYGKLFIFATCDGDSLYSLPSVVGFIPNNRFAIILVDFIEDLRSAVEDMIGEGSKRSFTLYAFTSGVVWDTILKQG